MTDHDSIVSALMALAVDLHLFDPGALFREVLVVRGLDIKSVDRDFAVGVLGELSRKCDTNPDTTNRWTVLHYHLTPEQLEKRNRALRD